MTKLVSHRSFTTWRKLLTRALAKHSETWEDVVAVTIADRAEHFWEQDAVVPRAVAPDALALDVEFDNGFGGAEGCFFTLWTRERVYFPTEYDGSEGVNSVPRNPCLEATVHG